MENLMGKKVKDRISGFEGIAMSRHEYLNGCIQWGIQAKVDKDGNMPEIEHIDQEDLKITGVGVKKETKTTKPPQGGIRNHP